MWCEAGETVDAFWRATPRTILAAIRGYWRRRGWTAWHGAMLHRVEKLPELDELMGVRRPATDQSPEAMRSNLALWRMALKSKESLEDHSD